MKRKIGKRIEERCVSLKCTKWCEEILCRRFKHACFARNFGFPYCPCNALCSARLNDFTHWVDSTSTKDSYTCGSHSQDNLSVRQSRYLLLNHWAEFNQTYVTSPPPPPPLVRVCESNIVFPSGVCSSIRHALNDFLASAREDRRKRGKLKL